MELTPPNNKRIAIAACAALLLLSLAALVPGFISVDDDPPSKRAAFEPAEIPSDFKTYGALGHLDELDSELATASHGKDAPSSVADVARAEPGVELARLRNERASSGAATAAGVPSGELFDCIIEPYEVVEVGSALTAVLEKVHVDRSDRVAAGQILAELESDAERFAVEAARMRASMEADLHARQASVQLGETRHQRTAKLFEMQAVSKEMKDEAETEAELARADLARARENQKIASMQLEEASSRLQRRTIRSPISGVVVERAKSPGEVVMEEKIFTIAQIDPLRVEVILPAAMFGQVAPGSRAEVRPELPNSGVRVASVDVVDPVIDAASGTFGVRLELPNGEQDLPSGLHCQVQFLKAQ